MSPALLVIFIAGVPCAAGAWLVWRSFQDLRRRSKALAAEAAQVKSSESALLENLHAKELETAELKQALLGLEDRHKKERTKALAGVLKDLEEQKQRAVAISESRPSPEAGPKSALESLLFVASDPIPPARAAELLGMDEARARDLLFDLKEDYRLNARGLQMEDVGGGYQIVTRKEHAELVTEFLKVEIRRRMSRAALEVLAIVAYHQPVGRPQVEALRGVGSEGAVAHLLERGLIRTMGRGAGLGRPVLFGTTADFLRTFGLRSLEDLPPLPKGEEGAPTTAFSPDLYAEIERRLQRQGSKDQMALPTEDDLEKVDPDGGQAPV